MKSIIALRPERDLECRPSYAFVDTLRFWSMLAVVAIHCIADTCPPIDSPVGVTAQAILTQAGKYGTIAFFVCSGFLLGGRVATLRNAATYFLNRFRNVGMPWAFWVVLLAVFKTGKFLLARGNSGGLAKFWSACIEVGFHTSYWFVPNLLVSLAIILVFRKHLRDWRLGAILLCLNLFYVVNVYRHWFATDHSTALFGFVSFLWLGAVAVNNLDTLKTRINDLSTPILAGAVIVCGLLSLGETYLLHSRIGLLESLNTLRITNQLYSVAVVILCVKLGGRVWPQFMDVRKVTYGIYLTHPIFLAIVQNALLMFGVIRQTPTHGDIFNYESTALLIGVWVGVFAVVYSCSYLASNFLASLPALAWTVGRPESARRPVIPAAEPSAVTS